MEDKLIIILGCDCDPDRPRYGGTRYDDRESAMTWRGVSEGIERLEERLDNISEATGVDPKVVFCLRSDMQMNEIYGATSWMIDEYSTMWRRLENQGHELAWHPHLWRWNTEWGCWFQETKDPEWISECLEIGFSGFCQTHKKNPVTCHMGWTFHNSVSMKKISELGLKVDFSACPDISFSGGPGAAGTKFDNMIDWVGSPQKWYRPSEADYRRPAREGESALDIVEIPKFTSHSAILKKAKGLATKSQKAAKTEEATTVFLQITALPLLYGRIIKERLHSEEAEPFFATYFHPDEFLEERMRSPRGFLYSLDNLEKNLLNIIRTSAKAGKEVTFATGAEAVQQILEKEI